MSKLIIAAALTLTATSTAMACGEAFYSSDMSHALPLARPAVLCFPKRAPIMVDIPNIIRRNLKGIDYNVMKVGHGRGT